MLAGVIVICRARERKYLMLKNSSGTPSPDLASMMKVSPPEIAFLIMNLGHLTYPDQIVKVLADIPGPAFFPGGFGLVTSDRKSDQSCRLAASWSSGIISIR